MHYETQAGRPTQGLAYAKLLEDLRNAQEGAILIGHLVGLEGTIADRALANGWLAIAEQLRRMQFVITKMAQGKMD